MWTAGVVVQNVLINSKRFEGMTEWGGWWIRNKDGAPKRGNTSKSLMSKSSLCLSHVINWAVLWQNKLVKLIRGIAASPQNLGNPLNSLATNIWMAGHIQNNYPESCWFVAPLIGSCPFRAIPCFHLGETAKEMEVHLQPRKSIGLVRKPLQQRGGNDSNGS